MKPIFEFRALTEADLELVFRWLNTPHVAEWYGTDEGDDPSREGIREKYLPYINGDSRTSHFFIIVVDDEPKGLIQWYLLGDYPEYNAAVQLEPDSLAVDMLIGDRGYVHRGKGPQILTTFLADIAFPASGAQTCYIAPASTNEAAKKAYAKTGFQFVKTVDVPGERNPAYIMRLALADAKPWQGNRSHQRKPCQRFLHPAKSPNPKLSPTVNRSRGGSG